MQNLLSQVAFRINDRIYLKDPASSDLGRRIISGSIEMIEANGFERFTFRKLGQAIQSTEASIYRYFESKHKLLLYLIAWYWRWMEYRLAFRLANIESASERLWRAIKLLVEEVTEDHDPSQIDKVKLFHIAINESSKAYLTREVDQENQEGVFSGYKALVARVSEIILEINPDYMYPHMLVTTVIEGAHHQRFFADHLPRLTNVLDGEDAIVTFYTDLVMKAIQPR